MGIFGALTTSVAGMRAQSFALENISGNIANSQTTAFKRIDTSFLDLIPDTSPGHQIAGSVTSNSRSTNTVQGDVQAASISTFMAINGEGFFSVQKPGGFTDNLPVFDGVDRYTRRGDFQLDKSGYLVNGAGYYLMGIPVDAKTGNLAGSVPQVLKFQNDFLPAQQTTKIEYRANLASYPLTTKHDTSVPGSELLKAADFNASYQPTNAPATPATGVTYGVVTGDDTQAFLDETISGGAVTAYDVSGSPVNLQFRWAKTDSATLGTGHSDTWNLFYQTNPNATGTQTAWVNAGTDYTFGANGQLTPDIPSITLSNVSVNGISIGNITLNHGSGGLTQFADANGNVQVNQIQQDGYPAGQLQSVSVSDRGRVVGNYSNGRNLDLAEITLANFSGANFLKRVDGGAFEVTDQSGPALSGASGRIVGSSLEGSNTDIADEFTKLIVTQQAYSANTRVITSSNQMVQDLLNMLR
ncbi:MAG: flagellar hook-basal body complex protein [Xanthobacteraceae bacterium]|nr:MAG: flagellar hook-basal body complex protein [Xanthobacteraceae bacterium]